MKIALFASAILFLGGITAAHAADRRPSTVYKAPVYNSWSGFYLGAHGGYGSGTDSATSQNIAAPGPPAVSDRYPNGAFGGLQAGFNALVAPHLLLGLEVDLSLAHIQGSFFRAFSAANTVLIVTDINRFGTARGRISAAFDRVLVYGTGGLAWGNVDETRIQLTGTSNAATPGTTEVSALSRVGWAAGGGVEYMVAPRWSLKAEYLYLDFGKREFLRPLSLSLAEHGTVLHTARLGVSYRL